MTNDIYTYIKENFNIKITDYTFKRDYIQNPLKKSKNNHLMEQVSKEDLYYLYITLNLSMFQMKGILGLTEPSIHWNLYKYKIKKPIDLISETTKRINYEINSNPIKKKEVDEKRKTTFRKKYGCDYYFQTKQFLDNWNNTEYHDDIMNKRHTTQKKNGTLGKSISKEELKIFETLKTRFSNVVSQYYSEKYPYKCDFYIPEIDMYIEYQGTWQHGNEPYVGTNEQLEKVKLWERKYASVPDNRKKKSQYRQAIYVWTDLDVKKRQTAKQNNLNYLEFFNINEFNRWFNGYKNVY